MPRDPAEPAHLVARKTWRTLEPLHGMLYFAPETSSAYRLLGFDPAAGYFVTRSAPMGAVDAETVVATFFNFEPGLVRRCLEGAWSKTTPEQANAARREAADEALRRMLGAAVDSDEMARAAGLARAAAESAARRPQGRALFAGHAALPWPEAPHLVLWHAQTLLREFRGDGHVAALVTHGIGPVEALVLHGASGEVDPGSLRATRGWPDAEWEAAVGRLVDRGWLAIDRSGSAAGDGEPGLTEEGVLLRSAVEDLTDRLAAEPYEALGAEACGELRALARPFSRTVVASSSPGPLGGGAAGDRR